MKMRTFQKISLLLCLAVLLQMTAPWVSAEPSQGTDGAVLAAEDGDQFYTTVEAAIAELREKMTLRDPEVVIRLRLSRKDDSVGANILYGAIEHTGNPKEGDYLLWHMKECWLDTALDTQSGSYEYTFTYRPVYRTTAEQEAAVDRAVEQLLQRLNVFGAGDYEKIKAIYDYICENVTYDYFESMLGVSTNIYTAYGALVQGYAVCQGYASLFYRLALELGVDTRVIAGTSRGQSHGWNIVKLNGVYYNLDSTWDAGRQTYQYFLLSQENFTEHVRKSTYDTSAFHLAYPMAKADYSPVTWQGDLTGNGMVDEDDAIYLLQHVLLPERFPTSQSVDLTADGVVDEDDAVYLLQHVLLPERFPLT